MAHASDSDIVPMAAQLSGGHPLEEQADQLMAPYAMLHRYYGGRLHGEEPHPYRTCFQRDRDRIVHSKAFRRLGYKTQVFINSAGDNYRTRLTHSLEVAQISRSVTTALRLNPDFAETLALAHDLGHTPFGHAGQDALNQLMREHGGFEHNCQSLRLVSRLETRYLDYPGLNLTRTSLKGMLKHVRVYDCDTHLESICQERADEQPCLEAALVDQCDRIAYVHHDLEDGLDSRILDLEDLSELDVWQEAYTEAAHKRGAEFKQARRPLRVRHVIRELMNASISDLLQTTGERLQNLKLNNLNDLLNLPREEYPLAFSADARDRLARMQKFLFKRLYRFPRVMQMSRRGARIIETLFAEFCDHQDLLPRHFQQRIDQVGVHRTVADYISGMTDRYAMREYARLTGQGQFN